MVIFPHWLCFDALGPPQFTSEVESIFRFRQNERIVPCARLVLLAAAISFVAFGLWDYWLEPDNIARTVSARGFFSLAWFILWAGTFYPWFRARISLVLSFGAMWAYIALIGVLNMTPHALLYGFMGFAFPQIALLVMPNARLIALNHVLLIVLINLSAFVYQIPATIIINANFLLFSLSILTYVSAFSIESRERRLFRLELELEDQAAKDFLSDTLNRRYFMRCAQIELDRATRHTHATSMLFLDIDFFKKVNDNYGHHIGDDAIRLLANTCRDCIRSTDFLARLGGEEFAILLPMTDLEPARVIAERIRERVSTTRMSILDGKVTQSENQSIALTVSIGVAIFHQEDNVDTLMQRADAALYEAKQTGRNRVVSYI